MAKYIHFRAWLERLALLVLGLCMLVSVADAQQAPFERLSSDVFDVIPPSARVSGKPGAMRVRPGECQSARSTNIRRRIVDIAIQEWAYFGFRIVDQTIAEEPRPARARSRWRRPWLGPTESARVAASIAGYWTVTPDGSWILNRQNSIWNGPMGAAARWRDPWSAAFISWVMCESGLGQSQQFERAIAHHVYIDQAIKSGGAARASAYTAYDVGESPIEPGDLLCSARRPAYRSIADRRSQLGVGARTHCDIVVKIDPAQDRILTIGGNVRGSVSMKLMAAEADSATESPFMHRRVGLGRRTIFAHLKLSAESIGPDALSSSRTLAVLRSSQGEALSVLQKRLYGNTTTTANADCCEDTPDAANRSPGTPGG